jgi:hypothetical protein
MRRNVAVFAILLGLLLTARVAYAWASERIGPDSQHPHPTVESPGFPANLIRLFQHESRVYSLWVNGSDSVYFHANVQETKELIERFSETRLRDHELWIYPAADEHVLSFNKRRIKYNAHLFKPTKSKKFFDRQRGKALDTYEPTLRVYLDTAGAEAMMRSGFPDNIVVHNQIADLRLQPTVTKPDRNAWHARVIRDDAKMVATVGGRVLTRVTLWETNVKDGIWISHVNTDGYFEALFSDQEIADLKSGESWITVTVGDWQRAARPDDSRITIDDLIPGRMPAEKPLFFLRS